MPRVIYSTFNLILATVYCGNTKDAVAHARHLAQYYGITVAWYWEKRKKEIHIVAPPYEVIEITEISQEENK